MIWAAASQNQQKWPVRLSKTRISLGNRPVWSESLLSTQRNLGSLASHWMHSEDSDQTGRMPRLIWVFAECTDHFVGFVMLWFSYVYRDNLDQPAHLRSLVRVISVHLRNFGSLTTYWAPINGSNQTAQIWCRLIWVVAGHTCHFVDFAVPQIM